MNILTVDFDYIYISVTQV